MTTKVAESRRIATSEDHWTTAGDIGFQFLWFEYLRLSPSYELARKSRAGELTSDDESRLPADFDKVLSVFDDLGDVQAVDFRPWWADRGIRFLGNEGEMLMARPVGVLSATYGDPLNVAATRLYEYIEGPWARQGQPTTAILSIPLGLTKTEVLDQVGFMFDRYEQDLKQPHQFRSKYPVREGKKDTASLFSYMKCFTSRALEPDAKLHEIGAITDISTTYSKRVLDGTATTEDKEILRSLTSRAIDRALMVAENAARGIFPSYERQEHAVSPMWGEMSDLIEAVLDREDCN